MAGGKLKLRGQRLNSGYKEGNKFACGSTRSGKSVAELLDIVAAARSRDVAIVCCDPHPDSLASAAFSHLSARCQTSRIVFDQITYFERVPGYQFLLPSQSKNQLLRESQDEQVASQFADILCRRGNRGSLSSSPLTEEWTMKAVRLLLMQRRRRPASDLRYAFKLGHPVQKQLIAECTDELIRGEFSEVASGNIKRGQFTPAARLIEGVCGSPAFRARCGNTFDLAKFLSGAGILLLEGGEDGVAPEVSQTIMASVVMQVINYVRQRPTPYPRVLLVLDEATNARLVSTHEARAMAECQKMGLDIHVLVQLLDFPSAEICNSVLSNSVRHEWFYNANPNVIRKAIDDLGFKQAEDDDEKTQTLRDLDVGERWVKYRDKRRELVWRERVRMLRNPWTLPNLAKKKAKKALEHVRQRPEYCTPSTESESVANVGDQPKIELSGSAAENLRRRIEAKKKKQKRPRLPGPENSGIDQGGDDD